jgi:hypothetical protein
MLEVVVVVAIDAIWLPGMPVQGPARDRRQGCMTWHLYIASIHRSLETVNWFSFSETYNPFRLSQRHEIQQFFVPQINKNTGLPDFETARLDCG